MSKRRNQEQTFSLSHPSVLVWFGVVVVLAVMTAFGILAALRGPTVPTLSVLAPPTLSDGDTMYLPGTNRQYVIVEVEVYNPTKEIFNFAPVIQTYLTDAGGNRYGMAPTELTNPISAGPLKPGEKRRGQLSYNTPKDARGLSFHFWTNDAYRVSSATPLW